MELTGRLIAAMPTKSGVSQKSGKSWMSREYVLEVPGQYPKKMCFTVFGEDRLKQFNLRKDDEVTVQFDIEAHEWGGRWFNEIRAYNVIKIGIATSYPQQEVRQQISAPQQPQPTSDDDTLPF